MKLGTKKIPDFRLSSKLISDMKSVFDRYDKNEITVPDLAAFLGHKSPTSGTFLYKISSLRAFGLMEGTGKVIVTDIGEKIALRENDIDYNNALISAVNRVPLWGIIFTKYTKVGKEIQEDKFWSELREHCGLTVEESQKKAPEILKWYREDTRMINMSLITEKTPEKINPVDIGNIPIPSHSLEVMDIGYEDYKVYLPKDEDEQKEVWKRLKGMVEAYLNPKE